jgi:hypothetical protein
MPSWVNKLVCLSLFAKNVWVRLLKPTQVMKLRFIWLTLTFQAHHLVWKYYSGVQVTNTLACYIILILYSVKHFTAHALGLELSNLGVCTTELIKAMIHISFIHWQIWNVCHCQSLLLLVKKFEARPGAYS